MAIILQESLRGLFYAPYYAAFALGAYDQEGVEVRFATAPGFGNAPTGLYDGSTDAAWGGPMRVNQLYEERADCDVVCFGEAVTRDPFLLVGREPKPDFTMADLRRVRLATVSEVPTPWLCLQHDLRLAGVDPTRLGRIPDRTMGDNVAALRAGAVDVIQVFQPLAEQLIEEGAGHLWYAAATRGAVLVHHVLCPARRAGGQARRVPAAGAGALPDAEMAARSIGRGAGDAVAGYFADVPRRSLVAALARYKTLGVWGRTPVLPRAGYERLKDGLVSGGFVNGTPFEVAVDNSLAEQAVRDDPPPL
ncbi:MAG: hypothetical protein JO258_19385 [Alphaproteobacteria bacterium]|nr:hypothetical protein [Alphaproteobacteria bacterium]